jgi:signal transduction histidine kinase/CheY-like chemotaxis protein
MSLARNLDIECEQELAAASRAGEDCRALLMQAPIAVVVLSVPALRFELANARYEDLIGRRMPEFLEQPAIQQILQRVHETGEPFAADEWQLPLPRASSGMRDKAYVKLDCQPVRDALGVITSLMATFVDVTPQVKARKRVQTLAEELQLADRRKDEFLAMLAHELRNPLAAISTSLELIKQDGADVERIGRHRGTAERQLNNLVRLVDDLLDVARITRGKVELRRDAIDFGAVVRSAIQATQPSIDARGHTLHVAIDPGSYPMLADAARLEQVVTNLLTNAAKYTEQPGTITVELTRQRMAGALQGVLRVTDTGRGIPPAMLSRIFDVFTQINPGIDRSAGGLGIGLTLVKRLVELHRGRVVALSEGEGKGAKLTVRLPLDKSALPQVNAATREPKGAPAAQSSRRIVIVEDSDDAREALKELLESAGHEVAVANDGAKGIERVNALSPDVAVIDIGLPMIDGYEVARRLRAEPGREHTVLIALTGYGGPGVRAKAEAAGFDMHLTKPVDVRKLFQALQRTR